jgi:hypothetical protein
MIGNIGSWSRGFTFRADHIKLAARIAAFGQHSRMSNEGIDPGRSAKRLTAAQVIGIAVRVQSAYQASMCSTSSTGLRSDGEKLLPV